MKVTNVSLFAGIKLGMAVYIGYQLAKYLDNKYVTIILENNK